MGLKRWIVKKKTCNWIWMSMNLFVLTWNKKTIVRFLKSTNITCYISYKNQTVSNLIEINNLKIKEYFCYTNKSSST